MARKTVEEKAYKYADLAIWNAKGNLKEGDAIDGYVIDKDEFEGKFGTVTNFILDQDGKGALIKVSGSSVIKNKFAEIPMGCHVWIKYVGMVETKRGAKKSYEVEYDDEDVIKG